MASDDARRAKARRNAKKSKATRRARRAGVAPADLTRARIRGVMGALVVIGVLVVGVWVWVWTWVH